MASRSVNGHPAQSIRDDISQNTFCMASRLEDRQSAKEK